MQRRIDIHYSMQHYNKRTPVKIIKMYFSSTLLFEVGVDMSEQRCQPYLLTYGLDGFLLAHFSLDALICVFKNAMKLQLTNWKELYEPDRILFSF